MLLFFVFLVINDREITKIYIIDNIPTLIIKLRWEINQFPNKPKNELKNQSMLRKYSSLLIFMANSMEKEPNNGSMKIMIKTIKVLLTAHLRNLNTLMG